MLNDALFLPKARLDGLIQSLRGLGCRVIGPVLRNGGVVFDEVESSDEFPLGVRDEQEAGRYRIVAGVEREIFGVVNGPGSLKPFFFAPSEPLLRVEREKKGFRVEETLPAAARLAIIGVRACDLAAVAVQDRIFLHDRFRDTHYGIRREQAIFIAVNCTRSVSTCFCASMNTGPEAKHHYDLALTELDEGFVLQVGSPQGRELAEQLELSQAESAAVDEARRKIDACAAGMVRRLETSDLPGLLYRNPEHPRWDDVAQRCLSCTNCTMVCPTCFCHTVVDQTEIDGNMSHRVREWDSCFSYEHAHIHGKNFRPHIRERYRQWLTHKLASWIDQFGTSGCVGCGRCITWCPVGIDLTEEVAAIRGEPDA